MKNNDFEKIAEQFALCAVNRNTEQMPEVVEQMKKTAGVAEDLKQYLSTPNGARMIGGLGAAGLGVLTGLMQPKRKGRNALLYGAIGGLGGIGCRASVQSVFLITSRPRSRQTKPIRRLLRRRRKVTEKKLLTPLTRT
jgi:hypothetical protein